MNRTAVFAHYDKDGGIEDYVVYYLKELKKVSRSIIFVSDSKIKDSEAAKIKDIAAEIIQGPHGEYDFGSYKRGYFYLKEKGILDEAEELIFANDSCFGPIFSLEKVFDKMAASKCDFWGMNFNDIDVKPHVQSFFVVFKENVFKSECFNQFMESIKKEFNKDDIIEKYEIGLSQTLINQGFGMDSYINTPIEREISGGIVFLRNNPLLKTCAFDRAYKIFIRAALRGSNYPESLILETRRYKNSKRNFLKNFNFLRKTIIKFHLKRREVYFFGRKIGVKK